MPRVPTSRETNKVLFREMSGEKHLLHAMANKRMKVFLTVGDYDLWEMPICSACERVAFWHTDDTAMCPHCGKQTMQPITFGKFYEMGHHTDRIVRPNSPHYIDRQKADAVVEVHAGEAGLDGDPNRVIKVGIDKDGQAV